MKKVLRWILAILVIVVVVSVIRSGFSVYDYGSECTRCLREYHVVEKKFYGFTYSKTETLEFAGYDLEKITGTPCQHVYRTNGFGREVFDLFGGGMTGDGQTAEGNLFRFRWSSLKQAYELYDKVPDKDLFNQTMSYVDSVLPADATVDFYHDPRYENLWHLSLLSQNLETTQTADEWRSALADAKDGKDSTAATAKQ